MRKIKVWDIAVRLFHWSLVIFFTLNALILDDESKLHRYVGYCIAGLVLFRIFWGFFGSKYARFSSFLPSFSESREQVEDIIQGKKTIHIGHTPLGALMIYNLLITLIIICLSGYLMTTDTFWGVEWPEELHEFAVHWAEISIILHVAAVVFESIRTRINLPRAMLTGYKELPDNEGK